jgi:2-phosphosulfolactate phosphatase
MVQRILELSSNSNGQPAGEPSVAANHHLLTDHAAIALNHWQSTSRAVEQGADLAHFFRTARGGINLVKIGHDADIVFASKIDTVPIVPRLDVDRWAIQ